MSCALTSVGVGESDLGRFRMFEDVQRAIVFVLAAAVVIALGAASATSQPDQRGWRVIVPSPMHWTGLGLSVALSGFMTFIYLFVGSVRADAAQQMRILFWLIVVFGLGAIVCAVSIRLVRRNGVGWRGATIAFNGPNGKQTRQLSEITRLDHRMFGSVIVGFHDGASVRLDPNASGAAELIETISGMLDAAAAEKTD